MKPGRLVLRSLASAAACASVIIVGVSAAGCDSGETGNSNVRIGALAPIPDLDPHKTTIGFSSTLYPLLWCSLTKFGPETGDKPLPSVATKWTASPDRKTYTFTLNPNAHFRDDAPIDAEAVVASVERALDEETGWNKRTLFSMISRVTAVGTDRVVFHLSTPNTLLPTRLTFLPIQDTSSLGKIQTDPNGCGPYKLDDFVSNVRIRLVPSDNYWDESEAKLDSLTLVTQSDVASAVTALSSGDLDGLWGPPFANIPRLKEEGLTILQSPDAGTVLFVAPNHLYPPFDDPRARQALAMSIDRATIAKAIFNDLAEPAVSPIMKKSPFYAAVEPDLSYDLDRAAKLWKAAGVTGNTRLVYWSTPANPVFNPIGEVLQASLKEIGINLEIKSVEANAWAARFVPQPKDFGARYMVIDGFGTPAQLINLTPARCDCNGKNERIASILSQAYAAQDVATQKEQYQLWQRELAEDGTVAPIVAYSNPTAVNPRIKGEWQDANEIAHFENATVNR